MHLDDGQVQRLLHGELAPADALAARRHLAECVVCRERVDAATDEEAEVFAALAALDHAAPAVSIGAIERGAQVDAVRRLPWAAGIVIALGVAGVAYAMPGSPLPAWLGGLTSWIRGEPSVAQVVSSPSRPAASDAPGVAVPPGTQSHACLYVMADGGRRARATRGQCACRGARPERRRDVFVGCRPARHRQPWRRGHVRDSDSAIRAPRRDHRERHAPLSQGRGARHGGRAAGRVRAMRVIPLSRAP